MRVDVCNGSDGDSHAGRNRSGFPAHDERLDDHLEDKAGEILGRSGVSSLQEDGETHHRRGGPGRRLGDAAPQAVGDVAEPVVASPWP